MSNKTNNPNPNGPGPRALASLRQALLLGKLRCRQEDLVVLVAAGYVAVVKRQRVLTEAGKAAATDVIVELHGMNLALVRPTSNDAEAWLDDNLQEPTARWCGAVVVEPRYLDELVTGMRASGLIVRAA